VHHLDSWIKRDQLDVTCFFVSLLNTQHVLDANTSILRSLRLICWVISWVVLLWYDVCWFLRCGLAGVVWCGIRMQAETLHFSSSFPTKTVSTPLPSTVRATCPTHLVFLDFKNDTILNEGYRSLSSSLRIFLYSPVTSSVFGSNILLHNLFNTMTKKSSMSLIVPFPVCTSESNKSYMFGIGIGFWYLTNARALC